MPVEAGLESNIQLLLVQTVPKVVMHAHTDHPTAWAKTDMALLIIGSQCEMQHQMHQVSASLRA